MAESQLIQQALAARESAHAPYSRFRVGAALLGSIDGAERIVAAANLENASLGLSICAERNAVARAVYLGLSDWRQLAIATDSPDWIPPCGACLQVIREFCTDLEIILVNGRGEARTKRLTELLPQPFTDFRGEGSGRNSLTLLPQILAKREGEALDAPAIARFVQGVSDGSLPDYQISALLMAIFWRGMDREETVALTRAMAESGAVYDWSDLDQPTADKHSTGGVGDKLSLVVAPLAASLGLAVPMLSGRGLGFTGGTLDKLEAIPGFRTQLSRDEFEDQMRRLSCAFVGQSGDLAPADRKLYALRDVTGTVESLPLIVSSILSKKIAAGPRSLVIDLKVGSGAFMPDLERARTLGEALRDTALAFGRRCTVLFTAMDAALGRCVGNGPEVEEALDTMAGRGPADVLNLSLDLVAEMARLAGIAPSAAAAREVARRDLEAGRALERFLAVVQSQGGRLIPEAEHWGLPRAASRQDLAAPGDGALQAPDARALGKLCVRLGAGRAVAEDDVDPRAGLRFFKSWGDSVKTGEVIACVEGSDAERVDRAAAELRDLLAVGESAQRPASLRLAILDEKGFRLESDPG